MSRNHLAPAPALTRPPAVLSWLQRPSPEHLIERLSQVDLLRALPPEEIYALVPYVERVEVPAGQRVFAQGEVGDALYLLEDGTARVLLDDGTDLGSKG